MSEANCQEDCCSPTTAMQQYDVPRSNPYMTLALRTTNTTEQTNGLHLANLRSPDESRLLDEPQYASPDEMKVISNKAYALSSRTFSQQGRSLPQPNLTQQDTAFTPQGAENNYYSVADGTPLKTETLVPRSRPLRDENDKLHCCQKALCFAIFAIAFFLAIGLSGASLAIVLLSSTTTTPPQPCSCPLPPTQQSNTPPPPPPQLTSSLLVLQQRLNQTDQTVEQEKQNIRTLTQLVMEIADNTTSTLLQLLARNATTTTTAEPAIEPTVLPSSNVTGVLHNCTSSIEANCTVPLMLGVCTTPCVNQFKDNTMAINFQCVKLESLEQNPLIGILDVADGQAFCFCYVIEVHDRRRTHLVDCALRVTRCSLADLTV